MKDKYCVIIGGNGVENARSPKVWNKFFKKTNISCKMYPLKVHKKNLKTTLNELLKDKNFLGGSVAIPHKEELFKILKKNCDNQAKKIGAINCFYKKNNKFYGENTDGQGFELLLKDKVNKKKIKKVLILGCGGAGRSVVVHCRKFFTKKTKILVSTRNKNLNFIKKNNCSWINWKDRSKYKGDVDIIVNCTSIGFQNQSKKSPLISLKKTKNKKLLIDIIYNPIKTKLLKIGAISGYQILNGLKMNQLQAALAIKKVIKINYSYSKIIKYIA